MEKKQIESILSRPFQLEDWKQLVISVFGAKRLFTKPQPIILNANKKAEEAHELGSFNTSDDRIIGLYHIKLNEKVWLERNKVGLREMLRSIYKYDVDGALIVFEQDDKWRLSFVSEIRTFDENGHITKKTTEPKRYTYLLGKGAKIKTPAQRLVTITGKTISLEDIRNAFSVEALNEEFYKIVARHFYQLVGATEGKGAKEVRHERILNLPIGKPIDNEAKKIYQEFAVRLIGRTVFCWFLKVKKSNNGISLLPEHLLSSAAVKEYNNYYHFILEKLFFQTLNTPIEERIKDLPKGCEQIPFLNGGLFEPQIEDYYRPNRNTGLSDNINTLIIPDSWFKEFFENLEQYNFTIDENSVVDIEVSVDPEMLGRIFENLLAEIDPDSGETARKATGSFYTPREIVDYMATESLVHYLYNQTKINKDRLHPIFKIDTEVSFNVNETDKILNALDRLKILDPACGSGAFPMGVLQKIVMALQKLDKDASWWKSKQVQKIDNVVLKKHVKQKLEQTTIEYARKIGIIQNSLYGVDIQPIAAEISKLRCFLTLIVDENIDETKHNRGVEPLPNLEFKFVTADALLKLPKDKPQAGLFDSSNELEELQEIRLEYLQSYGKQKDELKERFLKLQKQIYKQQLSFGANENSRAYQVSLWNPFSHDKVDWFDPLWMYGLKDFDIVIGNPPYGGKLTKNEVEVHKRNYQLKTNETAILFIERGFSLANETGIETYIIPKSFSFASNYQATREFTLDSIAIMGDCGKAFDNVKLEACIILLNKHVHNSNYSSVKYNNNKTFSEISIIDKKLTKVFSFFPNGISQSEINTGLKVLGQNFSLNKYAFNARGEMFQKNLVDKGKYKVIGGKDIDKYKVRSIKGYINDKNLLTEKSLLNENSVLVQNIVAHILNPYERIQIIACIPQIKEFVLIDTINQITLKDSTISNKFIWALLNSRLINWYSYYFIFGKAIRTMHFDSPVTSKIPVKLPLAQQPFINLFHYIQYLQNGMVVNDYVPNSHIVQLFEEVIDALVYELYFQEDFEKAGIIFMKYAERDFKSIEGKSENDTIEIIHEAYQTLREKDSEIRNNLKLMDIKLADLIMPIKTAR